MNKSIEFYRKHGIMTEIKAMKSMVKDIPKDIKGIVTIVQNILLHQHWASRYGIELDEKRREEPYLRRVEEKLILLKERGYENLHDKIQLKDKVIGICRDFSVIAAALCREVGIPARARCGFATYFDKDKFMDHWVLEYWNEDESRWILVDPQLDEFQREKLSITFDTLDIDEDYFITGPRAWVMCREGRANPKMFGIFNWWGYDYLKCNLILDANSLLKIPMQPWDGWAGYKSIPVDQWCEADYRLMDQLAEYALHVNDSLDTLYTFVEERDKIKVPKDLDTVTNFLV